MTSEKRAKGKQIRKVEKLDKAWREGGKQEGRTENDLAMHLGRAARKAERRERGPVTFTEAELTEARALVQVGG